MPRRKHCSTRRNYDREPTRETAQLRTTREWMGKLMGIGTTLDSMIEKITRVKQTAAEHVAEKNKKEKTERDRLYLSRAVQRRLRRLATRLKHRSPVNGALSCDAEGRSSGCYTALPKRVADR